MRLQIGSILRFMKRNETQSALFIMKMIVDRAATLFAARAECPVTAAQGRVLMYAQKHNRRPVTQGELEKYMGVSHATMKGLLERLETKGYVRTAFDSHDGRVKNVYLTETVKRDHARVRGLLRELEEQALHGLTSRQVSELRSCLETMYGNISQTNNL